MPDTEIKTVDDYMKGLVPERRIALERLRALIKGTVPALTESMRYRMPTYELDEMICAMASQKRYMSLYMDTELVAKHRPALAHLDLGKSCIRFKKIEDLPLSVVQQILIESVAKSA